MSGSIIGLDGQAIGVMGDPEKFRELRVTFEKKLQKHLEKFQDDIRESAVIKADINALKSTYHLRWNNDCDIAARQGLKDIDRDAFVKQVDAALAQLERRRMFTGPITPAALEMIGFRKWSDGSYRTHEINVEPVGTTGDWRITFVGDLCRDFQMSHIIRLMDSLDLKSLSPFNEDDYTKALPAKRTLIQRLTRRG